MLNTSRGGGAPRVGGDADLLDEWDRIWVELQALDPESAVSLLGTLRLMVDRMRGEKKSP